MLTPRNRLLFWTGMLVPFTALSAFVPAAGNLTLMLAFALAAAAAIDAFLAGARAGEVSVTVPELVRLSKNRESEIPLVIENRSREPVHLRIGLPLPEITGSKYETMSVSLPEEHRTSETVWPCKPMERGSFFIERCYFRVRSPYGFWNARSSTQCRSEIRVYPDLMTERRNLAAIFLNRGNFGVHAQRQIGQGRDFEKLREYIPGDSFDDIHWKATAKRGRPITKLYQIERTQEIYVVVDSSRLSARRLETGGDTALERFITAALALGLVAERQGDLFGVLTFSDRIRSFVRAGGGRSHYNTCRDAMFALNPEIVSPDFDELAAFLRLKIRRRALVMVLTDLGDPVLAESFMRNINLINRRHVVLVSMLKQPGAEKIFTTPDANTTDDIYRKLAGHLVWRKLEEMKKDLRNRGVRLALVENEKLSSELVNSYMTVKTRQQL